MLQNIEGQAQYFQEPRESDKIILKIVKEIFMQSGVPDGSGMRILDVGCATGNLLFHLGNLLPKAEHVGRDLSDLIVDGCQKNPALELIQFEVANILEMQPTEGFDVAINNAASGFF